jgi:hypothetical protein
MSESELSAILLGVIVAGMISIAALITAVILLKEWRG